MKVEILSHQSTVNSSVYDKKNIFGTAQGMLDDHDGLARGNSHENWKIQQIFAVSIDKT